MSITATRAAVLTAPGRGAIAVVGVVGPEAAAVVAASFRPASARPLDASPAGAVRFGRWGGEHGEEVVVVRRDDRAVEVHCHGGVAASGAILADLARSGVSVALADDPAFDLFVAAPEATAVSPLAREAWRALEEAPTERVAGVLLDQAQGAFDARLAAVCDDLRNERFVEALATLERLLALRRLGERLLRPTLVVIAGPPNVGKSRLANALLGYERSIVYDAPGTTRDVVTSSTAVDGWPVTIADTAGLRATSDAVEAAGVELARATARDADVLVVAAELGSAHVASVEAHGDTPVIHVATKSDLSAAPTPAGALRTSAVTGEGLAELLAAIAAAIAPSSPGMGEAVPFCAAQFRALAAARDALQDGAIDEALTPLLALLAGRL